jgi:hypothetical protein
MAEIAGALTGAASGFIAGVLIDAIAANAIAPGVALVVLVVLVLARRVRRRGPGPCGARPATLALTIATL